MCKQYSRGRKCHSPSMHSGSSVDSPASSRSKLSREYLRARLCSGSGNSNPNYEGNGSYERGVRDAILSAEQFTNEDIPNVTLLLLKWSLSMSSRIYFKTNSLVSFTVPRPDEPNFIRLFRITPHTTHYSHSLPRSS